MNLNDENSKSKETESQSEEDIDELINIMHKKRPPASDAMTQVFGSVPRQEAPAPAPTDKVSDNAEGDAMKIFDRLSETEDSVSQKDSASKSAFASHIQKSINPSEPIKHDNLQGNIQSHVSLDDFSDGVTMEKPEEKLPQKKKHSQKGGYIKAVVYIVSVVVFSVAISIFAIKVGNDVFAFVKPDKEVEITLPEGATTADVAKILHENGIIGYPSVYKQYSKFRIKRRAYLSGEYVSGTHLVNPQMNYDQLLEELSVIESSNKIIRITIPEGFTVKEMLSLFEKNGMRKASEFNEALEEYPYDYRFMKSMSESGISDYRYDVNYGYRLEGYLFPDTYDFYVDEEPATVIDKLLTNFDKKFDASFYDRCYALGYSVDEIVTLASMIEREGNSVTDYAKISSVFHNRLKNSANYPYLESDATVQYALGVHKDTLQKGDTNVDNPYNTYKYKGLPPGPICNPGYEAIYAALYPEDTNYYYFLSRNDGVTVYSRTYEEHQKAIAESNEIDKALAENPSLLQSAQDEEEN